MFPEGLYQEWQKTGFNLRSPENKFQKSLGLVRKIAAFSGTEPLASAIIDSLRDDVDLEVNFGKKRTRLDDLAGAVKLRLRAVPVLPGIFPQVNDLTRGELSNRARSFVNALTPS